MNRLEEIKEYNNAPRAYQTVKVKWEDYDWLIKIAEAASEFVESFERYNEDTYHNCITGPQRDCRELRKALDDGQT